MSYRVLSFSIGPMQNICHIIVDTATKKALVVDPAWEADAIRKRLEAESLTLSGVIATHAQYDHTNAITGLLRKADVPVYAQTAEIAYAALGGSIVADLGSSVKPVNNNGEIRLGETVVRFLHTPGHTPGSQCVWVGDHLLTGDTLFIGGCGRSDFPGGDPEALHRSLRMIATLPGHLMVCPGHDYGCVPQRPLSEESAANRYLNMERGDFRTAVA